MSVLTALTAQTTCGVAAVEQVSPNFVREQLLAIFDDIEVDVIKDAPTTCPFSKHLPSQLLPFLL